MKYDFSDVPMDTNGKQTNSISKEEFGMCWTKNNVIYINPNFRFVIKHYSKTDSVDDINDFNSIVMHTLAHELAHEVYNTDKLSNTIFKNNIINEAKKERFTTDYLDNTNYSGAKYDSELFAEYIAFKVTGK